MTDRLVTPVSNNLEKYYTYREYISKYNRAMRGEFWGIMALRDGIADDPEEALKLSYVKRDQIHGKAVSKIAFEPIE